MRVQQLRFKNLNSLVGEWLIDFTTPAYAQDGIFAITGPTGAGKSTILDALCLALYGRTPRLNKLSKSSNELMSRQTGECFAEVSFSTQQGHYRCHWSQHRARRNPQGDLQNAKHEIAEADSGKVLASKGRQVAIEIERATGMDFDRFTRSMLLAQGGFAAFLQASADERAPILEQITGTEIYSQISVRVHEMRADYRQQLEHRLTELDGMNLLGEEQEQALIQQVRELTADELALVKSIRKLTEAIQWHDKQQQLTEELKELQSEHTLATDALDGFSNQQAQLHLANLALELNADYQHLIGLRKEQALACKQQEQQQQLLPLHIKAEQEALQQLQISDKQWQQFNREYQQRQPIWRQVRELDTRLSEKQRPITEAQNNLAKLQQKMAELAAQQQQTQHQYADTSTQLERITAVLQASQADAALLEQFAVLERALRDVQLVQDKISTAQQLVVQTETQQNTAEQKVRKLEDVLAQTHTTVAQQRQTVADMRAELVQVLQGKTMQYWRDQQLQLQQQQQVLAQCQTQIDQHQQVAQQRQCSRDNITHLTQQQQRTQTLLSAAVDKQQVHQRTLDLLSGQVELLNRVTSLEQARSQLHDGEACPLCGSTQHPYASGELPQMQGVQQEYTETKTLLSEQSELVATLNIELVQLQKDLDYAEQGQVNQQHQLTELSALTHQQLCALSVDNVLLVGSLLPAQSALEIHLDSQVLPDLADAIRLMSAESDFLSDLCRRGEQLDNDIKSQGQIADRHQQQVVQLQHELLDAEHHTKIAADSTLRCRTELNDLTQGQRQHLEQLQNTLANYSLSIIHSDNSDDAAAEWVLPANDIVDQRVQTLLDTLKVRRQRWLDNIESQKSCESTLSILTKDLNYQSEQLTEQQQSISRIEQNLSSLVGELAELKVLRLQIFADKSVGDEEHSYTQKLDGLSIQRDMHKKDAQLCCQQREHCEQRINELQIHIADREAQYSLFNDAFQQRLLKVNFADETDFLSALMAEAERKKLHEKSQELTQMHTDISARLRAKTEQLNQEKARNISIEECATLQADMAAKLVTQKEMQQTLGAAQQRLDDNAEAMNKHQQHMQVIERLRSECLRWDMLHELIGSADGKKYRNFAQGLTFELMVAQANRQLQKMSDRYLLIRDAKHVLELNVIDNYQAGEQRSTKNLSGGESFIVSLALALGLSAMSSQNVRVDSLFLDEGFGTLDEDALDTALETLSGLHQEGKLIGVISHVPALKERIATQIRLIPESGGRSRIDGEGCSRQT